MPEQLPDDPRERRIPSSKREGTFDRDLRRTLRANVQQLNELQESVEALEDRPAEESASDLSDEELEEVWNAIDSLDRRVEALETDSISGDVTRLDSALQLNAPTTYITGEEDGLHTVDVRTDNGLEIVSTNADKATPLGIRPSGIRIGGQPGSLPPSSSSALNVLGDQRLTGTLDFATGNPNRFAYARVNSGGRLRLGSEV